MEVILDLGSKIYVAKANAITPHLYKNQFQSDILKDTFRALGDVEGLLEIQEANGEVAGKQMQALIDNMDSTMIYQLVWAFIKTKDRQLPPFEAWLEEIDYIPVTDLLLIDGFIDLLVGNITRKKK